MKKLWVFCLSLVLVTMAYSESGTIHLVYANGTIEYSETGATYEFDVQAYMSGGSDVIGDGMVYVEYPAEIFGSILVYEQKVSVQKTGILSGNDPLLDIPLYTFVNITDTKMNMFAVTFESSFNASNEDFKVYYTPISNDPASPSDLLHITMEAVNAGEGAVLFPSSVPDNDLLYFDYEGELFSGGLNIEEANEAVSIVFDTDPSEDPGEDPSEEPVLSGYVELADFTADLKKSVVTLKWTTLTETDMECFVIKRAEAGGEYIEIENISAAGTSTKRTKYDYRDGTVIPGNQYSYKLEGIDVHGNVSELSTAGIDAAAPRSGDKKKVLETASFTQGSSYPNPFNPSFTVPFRLEMDQNVEIDLYDMSGKIVANIAGGYHQAGDYQINVNCDHLGSGVYLLKTHVNGMHATQKMLLVK